MIERIRIAKNGRNATAPHRSCIFGPAPILPGEDAATYDQLLAQFSSYLRPADIIEEILACNYVDHYWQIIRWRRNRESLIDSRLEYLVKEQLRSAEDLDQDQLNAVMREWRAGKQSAETRVKQALSMANWDLDVARAQAFADKLELIERLDRLMTNLEWRCNAVLRELARHRASSTQGHREKIHELDDLEYKAVEAGPLAPKNAAIKGPR